MMVVKWNILLLIAHLCALCTGFESSYQIRQDGKGWFQYSYSPEVEGYVKLHTEPADWHSARVRCHMEGAFLASPWFAEFAALISKMQTGQSQLPMVYSGVQKIFTEGALTHVEGVLGMSSHPSDLTKLEHCGVFLADGSTGEVSCEELLPFVCYRPASNPGLDNFIKSEIEIETETATGTKTDYLSPSTQKVNIRNIEYTSTTDSKIEEYKTYTSPLPTEPETETDYSFSTTEEYVTTKTELASESIANTSAVAFLKTPDCGKANRGYKCSMHTGHCYKFHPQAVDTWYVARWTCEEEGGYLAIINSDVEAQVLKELFAEYPADKIHGTQDTDIVAIGYLKNYKTQKWVTIKGDSLEKAGYATWRRHAPHPRAAKWYIDRDGLLYGSHDIQALRYVAFICEKDTLNV